MPDVSASEQMSSSIYRPTINKLIGYAQAPNPIVMNYSNENDY